MLDTQTAFWLAAGGLGGLVTATVATARAIRRADKRRDREAVTAFRAEFAAPDDAEGEDLDAKWGAYWRGSEIEFRGTDLWAWLHADEEAIGKEIDEIFATALDDTQEMVAIRAAGMLDRNVKPLGYAGAVDMFAQWIHSRRRSVRRVVAVLDKTRSLPGPWRRQLKVLMDEGAVARAQVEVRARRERGEVWAR